MSILKLTSDTLAGTPAAGNIEYNGQFFATDSNNSRAQMQRLVQETAKTASGTSVDFTGIPAWVKRISVIFSGVSTSGTSQFLIQIGAGSITSSGYLSNISSGTAATVSTAGFIVVNNLTATTNQSGIATIISLGSNAWVNSSMISPNAGSNNVCVGVGNITLSGTLDRVRITTVNGTDTFDAGSINILYEG